MSKNFMIRRPMRAALLLLLMATGMMKSLAQPQGALNGLFSVSATKQVYFSQGNLQQNSSWEFAENQWDYLGNNHDLFKWRSNSYWNSIAISNGGNQTNLWRMLTKNEWEYVLYTRQTQSGIRFVRAFVNNVGGTILLPDDWRASYYPLNAVNATMGGPYSNIITASQWNILEQHGAVFLPPAGLYNGTSFEVVGYWGFYWSSTTNNSNAYSFYFADGTSFGIDLWDRSTYRQSVRLVCNAYTITANPSAGGTITGAGTYYENGTCTLTATANTGYTFVNWTKNGTVVSTEASYSFPVTGNASYKANFTALPQYAITVTANPTEGGTVTGAGNYYEGTSVTLTASANDGYTFINWTKDGEVVSTDTVYSFTVTEDATFVANFEANAVTQTIQLSQGWNWFSTYIEIGNPVEMLQTLEDALDENATEIQASEIFTEYVVGEWWGDLDEIGITNDQTYMIYVTNDCTVQLQGSPANPANHAIEIKPGWNWIGFPSAVAMDINEAFANFEVEVGDMIQASTIFTEFDGEGWFGDIAKLLPGQGYMYYSNSSETKYLVFPTSTR